MAEQPSGSGAHPRASGLGGEAIRGAAAVAAVALALGARQALEAAFGPQPTFITFYPAVMIAALLLGLVPGLLATILSALAVQYWLLDPRGEWGVAAAGDVASLAIFTAAGVFLSVMARLHQRARQRASALEKDAALRGTLDRLHLALRSGKAGAWEWDLRTGRNVWSEELWAIYGLAPHACEPSFEAWRATIVPEDREAVERAVTEAAARGSDLEVEWRIRGGNGEVRWLLSKGQPERDAAGAVVRYAGVVLDVTEQKSTLEKLAAETERLAVTLRSIGDAVIATDATTRITVLNGVAEAMTGWTAAEAVGRPLQEVFRIVSEETGQPAADLVGEVLRGGTVVGLANHTCLIARDGRTLPIADSAAPIRDRGGAVVGVVLVFRDQTGERRAEAALREEVEAKRQLASIALNVPGAIYSFRLRPDGSACVPFATPAAEQIFGIPRRTLAEDMAPVFAAVHAEDLEPLQEGIREADRTLAPWHSQFRYNHPAGGLRWVEAWSLPHREPDGGSLWHGFMMDVTDRKRAELALAESEELYRSLFQLAPSGVVLLDEEGRIAAFNDEACRQLGYTRAEFGGLGITDINVDERDPAVLRAHLARISEAGGDEFVARHRTRSGAVRQTLVHSRPAQVGGRSHFLAVWQDVTERRKAEDELRRSERRHRAIFEQAAVGVAEVETATGRIREINDRFCHMLGYSRAELQSMTWQDFTHPDDVSIDVAGVSRMVATGEPYRREKRYLRKDGGEVWASLTVSPFALPGETATSQIAIAVDVTERRRAEEAVLNSEARFRALIERSSDMIQLLDEGGRFQFWSQSSTEALGWTAEEMFGRPALALVHEADRERLGAAMAQLLECPGVISRESFRYQHKDGTWREIETVARNLTADAAVRGVVINSRDVTEQRRLEAQFQQAQKLESVGRLAGGIAHDFNNLLTIILSSTEALKEQVDAQDLQSQEDVEQIHAAGERARDLTRQLLAFARKQLVAPVSLDLNTVVRASQRMLGRLLGEDVELRVELQAGLWAVHADPSQVEQVILNLAVNARDAMPRGGQLAIETRNRSVGDGEVSPEGDLRQGDWVQLVVRDSGTGMTPEVRSHLFEPFFTTKEQGRGTGLGLATVYGIVVQAGGHVHVASEPERGTTFVVCFPRGAGSAAQPQPQPVQVSSRGTERVLVVEDDALVRAVIVRMLAAEGYLVTAVSHPRQALELGQEELSQVKLVVTDVVMPGIDGHALAVELRRRAPGLRVLYLSGYTRDAISERGVADSGAEFLAKPFSRGALLGKIRALLDGVRGG